MHALRRGAAEYRRRPEVKSRGRLVVRLGAGRLPAAAVVGRPPAGGR